MATTPCAEEDQQPEFKENPKAFGSLCIDTTLMHELIGETKTDWKTGIRRQVEALAPELLKGRG